jgi:hypothetical protein
MKKKWAAMFILSILMFSLVTSFASASWASDQLAKIGIGEDDDSKPSSDAPMPSYDTKTSSGEDEGAWGIFTGVLNKIAEIGTLQFLSGDNPEKKFLGLVRICYAIIVFTLAFVGLSIIEGLSRQINIAIGIVLAIIVAILTPESLLLLMAETYATIFAFVIIGAPIVGVLGIVFATPTPGKGTAAIKFFTLLVLLLIMQQIGKWATKIAIEARSVF